MIEFTSDNLEFRTWSGEEEDRLHSIMTDVRMPEFWQKRWDADEYARRFITFVQTTHEQSKLCYWALWHKSDAVLIGFCGLNPMGDPGEIEIGWGLAEPYWTRGLATEAALRAVAHAKWLGYNHLVALTQPHNDKSMRLSERIGMQDQGEVEGYGNTGVRYWMSLEDVAPIEP
jgi:RimJ/RimL family protein N-acetyltransferase